MPPRAFNKVLPTARDRPFYDELRNRDRDIESQAGLLDEENLNQDFQDYDLEHAGLGVEESRITVGGRRMSSSKTRGRRGAPPAWPTHDDDADNDNEVPASLLVEPHETHHATDIPDHSRRKQVSYHPQQQEHAIPGPSGARAHWDTTQVHQQLHNDDSLQQPQPDINPPNFFASIISGSSKKQAEWRWANVSNLDIFMKDVYDYYVGAGIWCIITERVLHLINVVFIAVLLTFLSQCVDYTKIRGSQKLSQIVIPQCTSQMSWTWNILLWFFAFYFIWKSFQYVIDLRRLINIRDFYIHLLNIPDHDMQTITWQDVVARVMALRDQNSRTAATLTPRQRRWLGSQSKERLDASDIANRIMRKENYLIAMFNKEIIDLTIPLPFLRNRQGLTRTLEWTITFAILDFVFDHDGQVNQEFLRTDRRRELSAKLRTRFFFAGIMILILAPFVTAYFLIFYFLMYYYEIQKNPSVLTSRNYTPLAEWKFREFNELPHLFKKRLDMSYPFATHYMDQFPKIKTEMAFRTIAFISGAIVTILAIASIIDPEMFLAFEITPDRTVLFYTAVFGGIWAFAHGSLSEANSVFDPEYSMHRVIEYTHYEPDHWKDRLHSFDIKQEFSELYKIKIVIFIEEILGILTTPFVLLHTLPAMSDKIIDFFREFTIHVDGLGYVCSFAEFDFKKGLPAAKKLADAGGDVRDEYYSTKHGKVEASYYGFVGSYANYALNPRGGAGAHLPPAMRNQIHHPPPAWPSLNSPPLGADMQASRMGRSDLRPRSRAPRHRSAMPQPSPMASILLDPHHQPPAALISRTSQAHRQRGGFHGERSIIQEAPMEDVEGASDGGKYHEDEEEYDNGGAMDESAWQTSPARTLSRDNSGIEEPSKGPGTGVVQMIYQFNEAQMKRRPGGVI
ncbi:autophagy protein Apg9-domain-containing protein [Podospora fimiseda]|uniref:Autophagy-related protein 9 n=1 Tax=Podospora fimiseda TaxID=252190 RepID=A0AAN7BRB4_9PEZI|nr:autophagy protein Apg9-domain-containing protein [Podospora fimiseda]